MRILSAVAIALTLTTVAARGATAAPVRPGIVQRVQNRITAWRNNRRIERRVDRAIRSDPALRSFHRQRLAAHRGPVGGTGIVSAFAGAVYAVGSGSLFRGAIAGVSTFVGMRWAQNRLGARPARLDTVRHAEDMGTPLRVGDATVTVFGGKLTINLTSTASILNWVRLGR